MKPLAIVGTLALSAAGYCASETFLISIPIADILGHRELALTLGATGNERRVNSKYAWAGGVEAGGFDRFELGFDTDFAGTTVYNAKGQLLSGDKYALSAGINGINETGHSTGHYVVGRYDLPNFRLHVGAVRTDRTRTVLGVDGDLGHGWTGLVDTTVGAGAYTWMGVNAPGTQWVVMAAVGLPRHNSDGVQHFVGITGAFRF